MSKLGLVLKGAMMGVAEVIPGVSGGTIAFITGIYEQLLSSIKSIGPELWSKYKEGGVKGAWAALDGTFLVTLFIGMLGGIGIGVVFVTYLLEHYPEPLWAFFFGLILASCLYIGRKVGSWNLTNIVLLIVGFLIAFGISTISPAEGSTHPMMLFAAGAIAISALILPGISGSFILLLMGMYTIIIPTLKAFFSSPSFDEFKILFIFGLGCLVGLAVFLRVLSWTFKNYHNQTLAILTGFMLGSLKKIWPWRNPSIILNKDTQEVIDTDVISLLNATTDVEYKILKEINVLPDGYLLGDPRLLLVILFLAFGFVLVLGLSRLEK